MGKKNRLRDQPIQFYVTRAEYDVINGKAKYCGLSVSVFLRKVSIEGPIIKRDFGGLSEVSNIGVNINQIARRVNTRGSVIERDIEELRVQYEKLFEVTYRQILEG